MNQLKLVDSLQPTSKVQKQRHKQQCRSRLDAKCVMKLFVLNSIEERCETHQSLGGVRPVIPGLDWIPPASCASMDCFYSNHPLQVCNSTFNSTNHPRIDAKINRTEILQSTIITEQLVLAILK